MEINKVSNLFSHLRIKLLFLKLNPEHQHRAGQKHYIPTRSSQNIVSPASTTVNQSALNVSEDYIIEPQPTTVQEIKMKFVREKNQTSQKRLKVAVPGSKHTHHKSIIRTNAEFGILCLPFKTFHSLRIV